MIITLNEEQINFAKDLGFKRSESKQHLETKNSKNFLKGKPPWHRHIVGALGELAYSLYSKEEIDTSIIGRGDNGYDFKNKTDIKASDLSKKPNLIIGVNNFERKYAENYVLAWVKLPEIELIGQISRNEIIKKNNIRNFGSGDVYFIPNYQLNKLI